MENNIGWNIHHQVVMVNNVNWTELHGDRLLFPRETKCMVPQNKTYLLRNSLNIFVKTFEYCSIKDKDTYINYYLVQMWNPKSSNWENSSACANAI